MIYRRLLRRGLMRMGSIRTRLVVRESMTAAIVDIPDGASRSGRQRAAGMVAMEAMSCSREISLRSLWTCWYNSLISAADQPRGSSGKGIMIWPNPKREKLFGQAQQQFLPYPWEEKEMNQICPKSNTPYARWDSLAKSVSSGRCAEYPGSTVGSNCQLRLG